jgi:hypothetical protein
MFLRKQIKMKQMLTNIGMGILLTACGNGGMDPVDTGGEDEYVPVRVETVTDNGIGTRAVTLSNAAIGIFRTAPYSATFPQQYDVECIHDGTSWSLASKIYVGSTDASLHAYYPYGKVTFGANSTVTALTVKDHTADNDFCYADAPLTAVNNRTPVASFLLKHAYAGLKFSIACHSTYPLKKCKLTRIVMKPVTSGKTFYVERSMDISKSAADAGQLGGSTASGWSLDTSALAVGTTGIAQGSTDESISKLFPPQDFEDDTRLILTIDGSEYSVTIPYKVLKALKAGYLSTISLEIKGTGVDVSGVKVYPWDTSVVPGGDNDATLD